MSRRPPRAVGAEPRRSLPRHVGNRRALFAVAGHPKEVTAGVQRHHERRRSACPIPLLLSTA